LSFSFDLPLLAKPRRTLQPGRPAEPGRGWNRSGLSCNMPQRSFRSKIADVLLPAHNGSRTSHTAVDNPAMQ